MKLLASHLRIGNAVHYNGQVHKIDAEDLLVLSRGMEDDKKNYSLIELTEQVLLECGFTKHEKGNLFFKAPLRYNTNTFTVKILRACNMAGESQAHECGYPILTDMIQCQHLHDLQNLFRSLTGEELTYKPTK